MKPPRRPLLTPSEVAARLRIGLSTVYRLAAEREIPSYKIGGARRFDEADLDRYLLAVREDRQ